MIILLIDLKNLPGIITSKIRNSGLKLRKTQKELDKRRDFFNSKTLTNFTKYAYILTIKDSDTSLIAVLSKNRSNMI